LTFTVGQTGYEGTNQNYWLETVFDMSVTMTVNGVPNILSIPMTHYSGWFYDELMVNAGVPVAFGDIIVTPLAWTSPDINYGNNPGGNSYDTVYAQVELVPEPTTVLVWCLLGLTAAGYGVWRKRAA
jgi:hypothetical protein